MKKLFKNLKDYFEDNQLSYTYLFFAQVAFTAGNFIWASQLRGDWGNVSVYSFQGYYNMGSFILTYFLPVIFIVAAFITSKYPKDKLALIAHITILSFFTSTIIVAALNELISKV